jgi:hypothetical protein
MIKITNYYIFLKIVDALGIFSLPLMTNQMCAEN